MGGSMGGSMGAQDPLSHEADIVWEENIAGLDYVRVCEYTYPARKRIRKWDGPGRRVGYSVLKPDAPHYDAPGRFFRREFVLMEHDRDSDPQGVYSSHGCPSEAVDPRTVRPGRKGEQTERAWGGALR
jgi:hypothetical protein